MVMSFCAVLFPTRCLGCVLDEVLNLIESVSEGFPSNSFIRCDIQAVLWDFVENSRTDYRK